MIATARSSKAACAAHAALAQARQALATLEREARQDIELGPTNWGHAILHLATSSTDVIDTILDDGRWPPYPDVQQQRRTWHDLEAEAAGGPHPLQNAQNVGVSQQPGTPPETHQPILMRHRVLARLLHMFGA